MSRPNYEVKNSYTGNGSLATYSFDFKIEELTQLEVVELNASGVETQRVRGDDVTYLSSVTFDAVEGAGEVTLAANLPNGYTLILLLANDAPTQPYEFRKKKTYTLAQFDSALDFIVGAVQRLAYKGKQALRLHDADDENAINPQLPPGFTDNPDAVLAVNDTADGFKYGPTTAAIFSASADAVAAAAAAALSEGAAASYASNASNSADDAAASATAASNSATNANASSVAASGYANDAQNSATAAAASASSGGSSASAAAASAAAALVSASAAATSAFNAAASEANAQTSASAAATSAFNAATSETNAAASAAAALVSEANAAQSALDAAAAAAGVGLSVRDDINNNDTQIISGLSVDKTLFIGMEVIMDVYRKTDTSEIVSTISLYAIYKAIAAEWKLVVNEYGPDDAGLTFSINNSNGEISYTSDDLTGANYNGFLVYKANKITLNP